MLQCYQGFFYIIDSIDETPTRSLLTSQTYCKGFTMSRGMIVSRDKHSVRIYPRSHVSSEMTLHAKTPRHLRHVIEIDSRRPNVRDRNGKGYENDD